LLRLSRRLHARHHAPINMPLKQLFRSGKPASLRSHPYVTVYRAAFATVLLFASIGFCQDCTTYVVVNAFDTRLHIDIETLKAEDFEARMDNTSLPIVSVTDNYKSRLLVLVEVDGADDPKIGEKIDIATRWARQAPDGQPVAFGIYADRAVFTHGFSSDEKERARQISAVIEESSSLGKRVALFDALHQAARLFGEHQPGDTVMLLGFPYDDKSDHSVGDIEKEYLTAGIRLMIMDREIVSRVSRDYLWSNHYPEKRLFADVPDETGGANSSVFDPHFFGFPWRGYLIGVKVPPNMRKPRKWQLRIRKSVQRLFPHSHLYYPEVAPPCNTQMAESQ
jgi:hypothetical protein